MKKHLLIAVSLLAVSAFAFNSNIPKQFRVWGRKAPEKLSATPIRGKVGIASIPIPVDFVQVAPATQSTLPENATTLAKDSGVLTFPFSTMKKLYSVTTPSANEIGKPARVIATPGEYAQLGFAFYSMASLSCVEISLAPFISKTGTLVIPEYYQDLRRVMDLPVPLADAPKKYQIEPRYLESFDEYDILNVPTNRCERFFLTVKIPEDAPAGIVKSTITIKSRGKSPVSQSVIIRILPFTLRQPNPETEMNFMMLSGTNHVNYTTWGKDHQPQLALRQLADMAEHGMTGNCYEHCNPFVTADADGQLTLDFDKPGLSCYHSMNDFLNYINRAGLTGPLGYYSGPWEWAQYLVPSLLKIPKYSEKYNNALQQLAKGVEAQRAKQHWQPFVYIVGDEPAHSTERMELSANCGRQILKACPNVDVSNFFNGMHGGTKDWKLMKDATTINNANYFTADVIKESREIGYRKFWNYNSVGRFPTDYRGERIAYGVLPWSLGSCGVSQYVLRDFGPQTKGPLCENIAYDHINNGRSDYDFTYPAADGPIPTPQWEAIRQGIYDYKYFYTLNKMIEECQNANAAAAAKAELKEIIDAFPSDYATPKRTVYLEQFSPETLDAWRWRIAQAIMKLQKAAGK